KSGLADSLFCVMYPKEYTWQRAPIIIYAKIASPTFTNVQKFISFAISEMNSRSAYFKYKKLKPIIIDSARMAVIYEYRDSPYRTIMRTAYIQVPHAVCYIVYTTTDEYCYQKYSSAFEECVKSFIYAPECIDRFR
ncbi:MAG TPA: hypothetical protein VMF29_01245, partial [Candidatus Edwardsbacteria bacterium]|nr:hypothetical protein [Candidatus Edwardsbacteria bacterium]